MPVKIKKYCSWFLEPLLCKWLIKRNLCQIISLSKEIKQIFRSYYCYSLKTRRIYLKHLHFAGSNFSSEYQLTFWTVINIHFSIQVSLIYDKLVNTKTIKSIPRFRKFCWDMHLYLFFNKWYFPFQNGRGEKMGRGAIWQHLIKNVTPYIKT